MGKLEEYIERDWLITPACIVNCLLGVKDEQTEQAQSLFTRWLARDPWVTHTDFSGQTKEYLAAWIVEWNLRAGTLLPFCASQLAAAGYQFSSQELNHPYLFLVVDTGWPYARRIEAVPSKLWARPDCVAIIVSQTKDKNLGELMAAWLAYLQTLHFWWQGKWTARDPVAVAAHAEALWQGCATRPLLRYVVFDYILSGILRDCQIRPNYWQWEQFWACLHFPPGLARFSADDQAYMRSAIRKDQPDAVITHHFRRVLPELLNYLGLAVE